MRSEEIERLLGGYATDSLTDAERQALFSAALDDQELFNALEDEEALRDLLQDVESRRRIQLALQQPGPKAATAHWYDRPWFWAAWAASAAAVSVLTFTLVRWDASEKGPPAVMAVQSEQLPPPYDTGKAITAPAVPRASAARSMKKQASREESKPMQDAVNEVAAAPQPPLPAASADRAPAQNFRAQMASRPGVAGSMAMLAPGIPVTLLRGDTRLTLSDIVQGGDSIRFAVRPPVAGVLTLYESGKPVGTPLDVQAGREYIVPETPIRVTGEQTFTLSVGASRSQITLAPGKPPTRSAP